MAPCASMLPGTGREGRSNRTEAKPGTRETLAEPSGSVLGERALAGSGVRLSWAEGSRRGRWGLFALENRTGGADSRLRMKPLECITGGASWSAGDPMKAGLGGSQSSLPTLIGSCGDRESRSEFPRLSLQGCS